VTAHVAALAVRAAAASDVDWLVATESTAGTRCYLGIIGRTHHEKTLRDPDQEQLVFSVGDTRVGFVVLAGLQTGGDSIELRRIVVADEHRGKGHGRAVFRSAVDRAFGFHRARRVWLDVKPNNARGLALYESEGFEHAGTIPDPTAADDVLLLMQTTRPTNHAHRPPAEPIEAAGMPTQAWEPRHA
jgi:ribosomal protein S18 acetylase RimI-like enzyme